MTKEKPKPTQILLFLVVVVGVCEGRTKPTQILQPRLNLSRS